MDFASVTGQASPAAGRRPLPAWPLAGMYVLVFTVLGCVGVSAGQALFDGGTAASASAHRQLSLCLVKFQGSLQSPAGWHEYVRCTVGAYRFEGFLALGAVGVVLALAAGLSVIVPWADRWRVARAGHLPDIPEVTARFESLCRERGVAGRRRPRLLIAGPGVRQAFTAALPGGRPLIVIPAAVAVAHGDPSRFDPVVLHEIAHVRARDVSWVSAVRWIAWITVPVIALAQLADFRAGTASRSETGYVVLHAAALVAATVVIAAGLLRRREIEADRLAVQWLGSPEALRRLLDTSGGPAARGGLRGAFRWGLRPLARHPSIATRIRALGDPLGLRDGAFGYALVTGVVAVMAMNAAYFIANNLDWATTGYLPDQLAASAGGVLLGFGLTPLLLRRAIRARRRGVPCAWWQPVAGTAAGMLLGSLFQPATPAPFALSAPQPSLVTMSAVVTVLLTASAGAGITTLAAGLASHAARRFSHRPESWPWGTAWLALAVACSAAAALWPIPQFALGWGSAGWITTERDWLTFYLPTGQWRWLALPYPAAVLLLTLRARPAGIRALTGDVTAAWRAAAAGMRNWGRRARAAAPALTPVCAAVAGATLFLPHSFPATSSLTGLVYGLEERAWVCTLAGWTVLVVLILSRGVAGLARACAAAWLATLLAGAEFFVYGAFTGHPRVFADLSFAITAPSVWLSYLAVPTSCLALLRSRPRAAVKRWWTLPAAAAAAAVLASATGIPGLLAAPAGLSAAAQTTAPRSPGPPKRASAALGSRPAAGAGRILTYAAAQAVAGAAGAALAPGWTHDSAAMAGGSGQSETIHPAACVPLQDRKFLGVLPVPVAQAQDAYKKRPGLISLESETITVKVESFSRLIPSTLLAAAKQDLRACHRFTVTGPFVGSFTETAHGGPVPAAGAPAWQADLTMTYRSAGGPVTWTVVTIGHNLIFITQQTITEDAVPPPDEAATGAALTAVMAALRPRPGSWPRAITARPDIFRRAV
jgi:Zn-dependent protease with chaperone function